MPGLTTSWTVMSLFNKQFVSESLGVDLWWRNQIELLLVEIVKQEFVTGIGINLLQMGDRHLMVRLSSGFPHRNQVNINAVSYQLSVLIN